MATATDVVAFLQLPPDLLVTMRSGVPFTVDVSANSVVIGTRDGDWHTTLAPAPVGAATTDPASNRTQTVSHAAESTMKKRDAAVANAVQPEPVIPVVPAVRSTGVIAKSGKHDVKDLLARLLFGEREGLSIEEVVDHLKDKLSRSEIVSGIRQHCVQMKTKKVVFREHLADASWRQAPVKQDGGVAQKSTGSNVLSGFFGTVEDSPERNEEHSAEEEPPLSRAPRAERALPKTLIEIDPDNAKWKKLPEEIKRLESLAVQVASVMNFSEQGAILTLKDFRFWSETYRQTADCISRSRTALLEFENATASAASWVSSDEAKQCPQLVQELSDMLSGTHSHAQQLDVSVGKLTPAAERVFTHLTLFRDLCNAGVLTVH